MPSMSRRTVNLVCGLALGLCALSPLQVRAQAQNRQNPDGEWRYQSGDAWGTRYSPANQVNASNFANLEVAWVWRGDNFGPTLEDQTKATPQYIDGVLYTVAGHRRTVVAMDPASGETLWTYREPTTTRWERSMRQNYGKGVAYGEIDGRGVISIRRPRSSCTRSTPRPASISRTSAGRCRCRASRRRASSI